jgi:LacI family transcriptional regulator
VTSADQPKRRPPSLREVAAHAQVAVSSASRVLADHPDVSESMRRRVRAAAEELGYEPDLLAQSLRRGATLTIGFVVRDISNPVLAEIALGAETALTEAGYSMLLTNSHGEPGMDANGIRLFRRRRVDGLLLSLSDERYEPTLREIGHVHVPIVLMDRQLEESTASAILSDHGSGVRKAIRAMIEAGHRRIGMVTGEPSIYPMRVVEAAVRDECAKAGVEVLIESGAIRADEAEIETGRLLDRADPPTALLTSSNQILVGALRALRSRDLHIPDDVSVATFDDIPLLELLDPPIAVISRHPSQLGLTAAQELLSRIREGSEPRVVMIPTTFDPRASIGPPPDDARPGAWPLRASRRRR